MKAVRPCLHVFFFHLLLVCCYLVPGNHAETLKDDYADALQYNDAYYADAVGNDSSVFGVASTGTPFSGQLGNLDAESLACMICLDKSAYPANSKVDYKTCFAQTCSKATKVCISRLFE